MIRILPNRLFFMMLLACMVSAHSFAGENAYPLAQEVVLTEGEQTWLAGKHRVSVRVTNFPPYVFPAKGEPEGIAIDYLKLISERTGIDFVFTIETRPRAEAIESLENLQGPDLILCMNSELEQNENILFSKSYVSSPQVIFTRTRSPFISGIDDLHGKTVAMPRVHFREEIKEQFKDIEIQFVDRVKTALEAVSTGQADAYIGDLTLASYLILEHGYSNVGVAAPSPLEEQRLSFGLRRDWPELCSIINKILDSISPGEKTEILSRYLSVHYEHGIRPGDVLKWGLGVLGFTLIIVLLFVVYNRELARKVKERTTRLAGSELRYRSVVEDSPGLICRFEQDGIITFVNDAYCTFFDKDNEELVGKSFFSLVPEEDREGIAANIACLTPATPVQVHEHRIFGFDGEIRWQRWTNRAMFDEKGRVTVYQSFGEDITERKKAEERLNEYQQRLRALASELTIAEERERRRIAADLHDHVQQSLAAARLQLAAARKSAPQPEMNKTLDDISESLREALQDTRQLVFDLSAPAMNEIGLAAAVSEWLREQVENRHGLETVFVNACEDLALDDDVRAILFRSVRELLANVVKHSQACRVSVHMKHAGSDLKINIRDDGIGFDPGAVSDMIGHKGGFGLFSIRERMTDLGGALEIISETGKGCEVVLTAPLGTR